jgi:hypothetical protein
LLGNSIQWERKKRGGGEMGIKAKKSYTADEIRTALEGLDFTVTICEPRTSNFLVTVEKDGRESTASCTLNGDKCKASGLTGNHGLKGLSKSALESQ